MCSAYEFDTGSSIRGEFATSRTFILFGTIASFFVVAILFYLLQSEVTLQGTLREQFSSKKLDGYVCEGYYMGILRLHILNHSFVNF